MNSTEMINSIQIYEGWTKNIGHLNNPGAKDLTKSDILDQISIIAEDLQNSGVRPGDRIILWVEQDALSILRLFAIWKCQATAIPLDFETQNRESEWTHLKKILQPSHSVGPDGHTRIPGQLQSLPEKDFGIFLVTSGTVSSGRICFHTLSNVNARISAIQSEVSFEKYENTLCLLSLAFGHGLISNILSPFLSGGRVTIVGKSIYLNNEFFSTVSKRDIQFISGTPTTWKLICAGNQKPMPSVKRIHCASEPYNNGLTERLQFLFPNAEIYNIYGLTELASWVSGQLITTDEDVTIGKGWNCEIKLEGDEIFLRSPSLMNFFYLNGELKYLPENSWYATGDTAESSNSSFRLLGRKDDQINVAGSKIYPSLVESIVMKCPQVLDVCVFACNSPTHGRELAMAVVTELPEAKLLNWLKKNISDKSSPTKIFYLNSLPKTKRGKLDRAKVKELYG